jgi:ABC-type antimicrobial peptide transport system permease subunit
VRTTIQSLDPSLAVFNIETMEQHVNSALFLPHLAGTLFGIFGAIGLLLAAVGLYGVMNYSVTRRTREIGIRLALGAQTTGIQRLIVSQGMRLVTVALVLGFCAAWAVAKVSASFLYGIRPHDAWTFSVVPVFLAAVALLACWIPSHRAAKVDPMQSLRHE